MKQYSIRVLLNNGSFLCFNFNATLTCGILRYVYSSTFAVNMFLPLYGGYDTFWRNDHMSFKNYIMYNIVFIEIVQHII